MTVWLGDRDCCPLPILSVRGDSKINHTGGGVRWLILDHRLGLMHVGLVTLEVT